MGKMVSSPRRKRAVAESAPEITTFSGAVRYLYDRVDFERMRVVRYDETMFKLDRMRRLLDGLGNPHEQIRTVHVAGTLGKGSTAAMIGSMLQGAGTAAYQSECAAGGRYGALRIVPAVPAPRKAKIPKRKRLSAFGFRQEEPSLSSLADS